MLITIAARYRPFSHRPGVVCIVPGTDVSIQVFPALIKIGEAEIALNVKGPVKDFTLVQDLEKGYVTVFGKTASGYMRYKILCTPDGLVLRTEKVPEEPFVLGDATLVKCNFSNYLPQERLSLGMHKALDWDLVSRRQDLREILPVWHRLGLMTPPGNEEEGASLLDECRKVILDREKEKKFPAIEALFLTGFSGILNPRSSDEEHQGFALPPVNGSPITLLSSFAKLIRSMFLRYEGNELEILPALPPEIVSGRLCSLTLPGVGNLDLEWSKREVRRLIFKPLESVKLAFRFPKNVGRMRVRLNDKEKGVNLKSGISLDFEGGRRYFFDRFQK